MNKLVKIDLKPIPVKIKIVPVLFLFLCVGMCSAGIGRFVSPIVVEKQIMRVDTLIVEKKVEIVKEKVIKEKVYPIKELMGMVKPSTVKSNSKNIRITEIVKDEKVLEFLCHNQVLQRAYQVQQKTGLNMAVILAQKGLESNWGTSKFTSITKNLGNIKCFNKECRKRNKKGLRHKQIGDIGPHCVQLYDDSPKDRFVRFETFQGGWNHYCSLIENKYGKASSKSSNADQANTMRKLGYATDPKYASKIISIIQKYNLDKLEKCVQEGHNIVSYSGQYVLLEN